MHGRADHLPVGGGVALHVEDADLPVVRHAVRSCGRDLDRHTCSGHVRDLRAGVAEAHPDVDPRVGSRLRGRPQDLEVLHVDGFSSSVNCAVAGAAGSDSIASTSVSRTAISRDGSSLYRLPLTVKTLLLLSAAFLPVASRVILARTLRRRLRWM